MSKRHPSSQARQALQAGADRRWRGGGPFVERRAAYEIAEAEEAARKAFLLEKQRAEQEAMKEQELVEDEDDPDWDPMAIFRRVWRRKIDDVFRLMDEDDSGFVEVDELKRLYKRRKRANEKETRRRAAKDARREKAEQAGLEWDSEEDDERYGGGNSSSSGSPRPPATRTTSAALAESARSRATARGSATPNGGARLSARSTARPSRRRSDRLISTDRPSSRSHIYVYDKHLTRTRAQVGRSVVCVYLST